MLNKVLLLGGLGLIAGLGWSASSVEPSEKVTELRNPALPGSVAPSLSSTTDGRLILSWLEPAASGKSFRFSVWNGKNWTAPETIVQREDFDVYAEAPPVVLRLGNGMLLSLWGQKIKTGGKWDGSHMFSSVSNNSGKTWSAPLRVHTDASPSEHSFTSAIPLGEKADVIWLDARDYEVKKRYRLMSAMIDSNGYVSGEKTVDEDTCTCCPTALVKTATGAVAAYRGRNPQEIRDIKVARLSDGNWQTPHTVHDDVWKINGCPVNGPALASSGKQVAIVWFTGSNDKPEVKFALSDDQGVTFQAPITLDTPNEENRPVGHVAVSLLDDGSAVAFWLRHQTSGTDMVGERISPSGHRSGTFIIARGTETSLGYPRVQHLSNQLVVSWGGKTGKEVKTAIITTR
ncbi:MAG TPA: sialidase family protein [Candidatus Acidoferrum sp.]|nr:sialidase family protein [Candidatus Acidoferrum sp.]